MAIQFQFLSLEYQDATQNNLDENPTNAISIVHLPIKLKFLLGVMKYETPNCPDVGFAARIVCVSEYCLCRRTVDLLKEGKETTHIVSQLL